MMIFYKLFECVLDAEVLLLTQPFTRILSSRKTPVVDILKFLIFKGFTPTPQMTKGDLCLAFKSLIENQPDYISPLTQQMPVTNNMLALTQSNTTQPQSCYTPVQQQVCIKLLMVERNLVIIHVLNIDIYFLVTYVNVNTKYCTCTKHKKRSKRT